MGPFEGYSFQTPSFNAAPSMPQMNFGSMAGLVPQSLASGGGLNLGNMPGLNNSLGNGLSGLSPQSNFNVEGGGQGGGGFWGMLDDKGNINWDNMGNLAKGASGLTQAGFGVANYFDQKRNNKDARAQADEMMAMQEKMNALNSVGQQRYMQYKGWGSDDQKDKYNKLVDDLTNTALA